MKKKPILRRGFAYLIDILIVVYISSIFINIDLINPLKDEYNAANKAYTDYFYNQLQVDETSSNDEKKEAAKSEISSEENTEEEIKTKSEITVNSKEALDLTYNLTKSGIYVTIIELVIMLLYFIVFQWLNNGKTIGKLLLKIRVVSKDNQKVSLLQMFVRCIIIDGILTSTISLILVIVLSKSNYQSFGNIVDIINMSIVFSNIACMLLNKDGKGWHDILTKTNVVYINEIEDKNNNELIDNSNEIKEAKITEKKNKKDVKKDVK